MVEEDDKKEDDGMWASMNKQGQRLLGRWVLGRRQMNVEPGKSWFGTTSLVYRCRSLLLLCSHGGHCASHRLPNDFSRRLYTAFLIDLNRWYTTKFEDYLVAEKRHFLVGLLWHELLLLWPLSITNVYAILAGKSWFGTTSLVYGASLVTSMATKCKPLENSRLFKASLTNSSNSSSAFF